MKRATIIAVLLLSACATSGGGLDPLIYSAQVDPASIRDRATFERDWEECKTLVKANNWATSLTQDMIRFRMCLRGRGYSVIG
jgi:hypothetical protein